MQVYVYVEVKHQSSLYPLVHSGCHYKTQKTEWLIINKTLVLTVSGAESSTTGCQHCQILLKALFQVGACPLLTASSYDGRG